MGSLLQTRGRQPSDTTRTTSAAPARKRAEAIDSGRSSPGPWFESDNAPPAWPGRAMMTVWELCHQEPGNAPGLDPSHHRNGACMLMLGFNGDVDGVALPS
ncbi:hypothetical protein CLAIMM_11222 isoform 2, partial [Cladophialophora immunda]